MMPERFFEFVIIAAKSRPESISFRVPVRFPRERGVLSNRGIAGMPRIRQQAIHTQSAVPPEDRSPAATTESAPSALICEAITLPAYDELPYVFELEQGELLEFTLRSDVPVDLLLCDAADYDKWVDSGYDPENALQVHLEAEDVLAYTLRFTAPLAGEYAVLLMNWTECPADLAIEIPDWLAPALW
jgi:hypothetical protein